MFPGKPAGAWGPGLQGMLSPQMLLTPEHRTTYIPLISIVDRKTSNAPAGLHLLPFAESLVIILSLPDRPLRMSAT